MRPPSYYTSLANSNRSSSPYSSSTGSSSNGSHSSSSSQFRSSLAGSSSSSYVTRTHLPYVSQSMLVAHCITGSGSTTKPYGNQSSTSISSSYKPTSSYSSSNYHHSTSSYHHSPSRRSENTISSSHRNPYLNSSSSSSTSSYLSTSSSYRPSNSSSSSSYRYQATGQRPSITTSSYYKPLKMRERPLLTQISHQLNTAVVSNRFVSPKSSEDTTVAKIEGDKELLNDPIEIVNKKDDKELLLDRTTKENNEEQDWSSDVTRNISRNKYLIKFREIDKPKQTTTTTTTTASAPFETEGTLTEDSTNAKKTDIERSNEIEQASGEKCIVELEPLNIENKVELENECDTKSETITAPIAATTTDAPHRIEEETSENNTTKKKKVVPKEKRNIKLKIKNLSETSKSVPIETKKDEDQLSGKKQTTTLISEDKDKIKSINGETSQVINVATKKLVEEEMTQSAVTTNTATKVVENQSIPASPTKIKTKIGVSKKMKIKKQPSSDSTADGRTPPTPEASKEATLPNNKKKNKKTKKNGEEQPEKVLTDVENVPPKLDLKTISTSPPDADEQKRVLKVKQSEAFATGDVNVKSKSGTPTSANSTSEVLQSSDKELFDKPETNNNKRIRFRQYHYEDFNFLTVLGHGGWGFVILAELKQHDACFAVKCIKKITIVEDDDFDSIMIERKVLTLGNVNPYICKLFCTFETDAYLFFVMEYCAGGDLMFHVQKEGKFTEPRCRFYAAEIICAIKFLHKQHIIYRDLKLDNILLDADGHVRLVDFGMCQLRTYREEMLPSNFCGTPEYISPEIIKGVPYNHSVDWWSFGVLLYEMAIGKMPFRGMDENELLWNVCYEQIHYPMFLTKELTSLLQLLLEREPTKRMGMATCKAGDIHDQPWFRGVDWAVMEEMRAPPPFIPEVNSKRDVQNFDADFTQSTPELSPVDPATLARIEQDQFQTFPYTNPNIFIFD